LEIECFQAFQVRVESDSETGEVLSVSVTPLGTFCFTGLVFPDYAPSEIALQDASKAQDASGTIPVNSSFLRDCIAKLWEGKVEWGGFIEASSGTEGVFMGKFNGRSFAVINNVTRYNTQQITDIGRAAGQLGPNARAAGITFKNDPTTNYTASDQFPNMVGMTQVHELGNSLAAITGIDPGNKKSSDRDAGQGCRPSSGKLCQERRATLTMLRFGGAFLLTAFLLLAVGAADQARESISKSKAKGLYSFELELSMSRFDEKDKARFSLTSFKTPWTPWKNELRRPTLYAKGVPLVMRKANV
jgi:hypothetical protein